MSEEPAYSEAEFEKLIADLRETMRAEKGASAQVSELSDFVNNLKKERSFNQKAQDFVSQMILWFVIIGVMALVLGALIALIKFIVKFFVGY